MKDYSIVIVGAGAAGIGFGAMLKRFEITDFLILERGDIAQSFLNWPKSTRFITPSFTTNGFGFPDINAVVPNTSPAFTFEKEHLSGKEYANYLHLVAQNYDLPIQTHTSVEAVEKEGDFYILHTALETIRARYVIFATGEFQNPYRPDVPGAELGMHYGEIETFGIQSDSTYNIIGGNESGCDALINLTLMGTQAHLYTQNYGKSETAPDPSISLSPLTKEKIAFISKQCSEPLFTENKVLASIEHDNEHYRIDFEDGSHIHSETPPVLATGFRSCLHHIDGDLFTYNADGIPQVNEYDESTIHSNLFLIGPSVRQKNIIFCYIYKFRQRFLHVLKEIAARENWTLNPNELAFYKENQMELDQHSCCDVICDC